MGKNITSDWTDPPRRVRRVKPIARVGGGWQIRLYLEPNGDTVSVGECATPDEAGELAARIAAGERVVVSECCVVEAHLMRWFPRRHLSLIRGGKS